jgi:hypothetical protein
MEKYKKKVCVVGKSQFRVVSSSVVTFVHVMHSETPNRNILK